MTKKNKKAGVTKKEPNKVIPAPAVDTTTTVENSTVTAPEAEPVKKEPSKKVSKKQTSAPATRVNVVTVGDLTEVATNYNSKQQGGLDANHQVDILMGLKGMIHDDPQAGAKYDIPEDSINAINKVVTNGFIIAMINEIEFGKSPFAMRMKMSQLEAIKEFAPMLGVNIDTTALPAPDVDGNVMVESKDIVISEETKAAAKAAKKVEDEKPTLNPAEIKSESQLKKSLDFIFGDKNTPQIYDRIEAAVNFYKSYLQIVAKKENDDAKYAKIESTSRVDLFREISKICHDIPFSTMGLARYMGEMVGTQKSPLSAFLSLKKAAMASTSKTKPDDQLLADMVKVLVIWTAQSNIEKFEARIKECNKNLEVLNKDPKKNAEGINSVNEGIKKHNESIDYLNDNIRIMELSSTDIVKNLFLAANNIDAEDPTSVVNGQVAKRIIADITSIYYPDTDMSNENNVETLNNNVVQMAGIIINMFREPNANDISYSIGNLKEVKKAAPVEKPAEEPAKPEEVDTTKK